MVNRGIAMKKNRLIATFALFGLVAFGTAAFAADDLPQKSKEGMDLTLVDGGLAVYTQPEISFSPYTKVLLLDAYVGFRENWVRDFNRSVLRSGRITDADLEKIRVRLADGFREIFTDTLTNDGGYAMVSAVEEGAIILRPALVDVALASPEATMDSPSLNFNLFSGTGMTMVLEVYDAATSGILARIYNRQDNFSGADGTVESRSVSRSNEEEIFSNWADSVLAQLQREASAGGDDSSSAPQ